MVGGGLWKQEEDKGDRLCHRSITEGFVQFGLNSSRSSWHQSFPCSQVRRGWVGALEADASHFIHVLAYAEQFLDAVWLAAQKCEH